MTVDINVNSHICLIQIIFTGSHTSLIHRSQNKLLYLNKQYSQLDKV